MITNQRGTVLVLVVWLTVLSTVLALALSNTASVEIKRARSVVSGAQALAASESGVNWAIQQLCCVATAKLATDGRRIRRTFDAADLDIYIQNQKGLFNINSLSVSELQTLFAAILLDGNRATVLAAEVEDWRDSDSVEHAFGAELDAYLGRNLNHGPRNGAFSSHRELQMLATITPTEYRQLVPYVTVHGGGSNLDLEFAPEHVLLLLTPNSAPREDFEQTNIAPLASSSQDPGDDRGGPDRSGVHEIRVEARVGNIRRRASAMVIIGKSPSEPYAIIDWRLDWGNRGSPPGPTT